MASSVIGALRVDLGIDTAAFSDGLKSAGSKLAGFGASLRKAIVPMVAIGTAAAAGVGVAVKNTIDAADEMSKAAAKFGIPIETLSRLKYAADLSDVSLQGLGTAVGRLSRQMADAAAGTGEAVDAFASIGVAFQNADGSLRPTEDVLSDIADRFAAMPDGAAKTAAAMELMGRSGAEMIPLLNGGAKALEEMKAEADTFGQVFTAEMGANAEAFNDNMTRLRGAFGNIAADLTAKLLPYLAQFTDWLVENGPRLANVVVGFVNLGAEIIHLGQAVVKFVTDAVAGFQRFDAEVTAVVVGIEQTLASLPAKFIQIGRDIIAGLLAGLKEKWETVKAWFQSLAENIPQWVRDKLGIQSPSTVFAEIGTNIMQGLAQGLDAEKDGIKSGVDSFAQGIASTFIDVLKGATSLREGLGDILGGFADKMLSAGIGGLGAALGIPGFANGTNFAPGGAALVGERGPELVHLPRGSRVTPNHALGATGRVEISLGPDLEARFLNQAAAQSVTITQAGIKRMAPGVVADAQRRGA